MNTSPTPASEYPTAETIRLYSELLLSIRKSLLGSEETTPETLTVTPDGLSTGPLPFPGNEGEALALWLDLRLHKLVIATSYGSRFELTLQNQTIHSFADAVLDALAMLGVTVEIDMRPFTNRAPLAYDTDEAAAYLDGLDAEME